MDRIFNMDNPFFRFMGRVADLMALNLLWLLCCIPIITMGASTTALYYSTLKIVRNEDASIIRMFFHSFRKNLKQGIFLNLIFLAMGLFLFIDIRICFLLNPPVNRVLLGVFLLLALGYLTLISYSFPMLAQFDNSLRNLLKNALLMGFSHLPFTIIIILLNLFPVLFFIFQTYYFLRLLSVWLFIGFSGIAWLNSHMFKQIFARYMPDKE